MIKFSIAILVLYSWVSVKAQNPVIITDTLYSEILQEKRVLQIQYPTNYLPGSANKFDAIYVLDGEWNTSLTGTACHFLSYAKFIPQDVIIIGINNPSNGTTNLRDRDFTPTHTQYGPVSGGADKFLAFVKDELIPYMHENYPVRKERSTLYGTSLGGLFVLYAFLKEPQLFKSYLTVEPSSWWDNNYITDFAASRLEEIKEVNSTLWISSRDGIALQQMGIKKIDSVFRIKAPSGLVWKSVGYPNETHFSAIWKGIYDGLKFSYTGRLIEENIRINPMNGIVLKDKPFHLSCYNLSADSLLRYTIDGATPAWTSSRMKRDNIMTFSDSKTLIVRSFSPREEFNYVSKGYFQVGNVLPSQPRPKGAKSGGLRFSYYEGNWDTLPNLKKLKPQKSGIADKSFNLNNLSDSINSVLVLDGYLEIAGEGYYTFEMESHDGARVYLGDQLVIGDNNVENFGERFIIPLTKGFYPLTVKYLHRKGGKPLKPVYIMPDGKNDYQIPPEVLYSK